MQFSPPNLGGGNGGLYSTAMQAYTTVRKWPRSYFRSAKGQFTLFREFLWGLAISKVVCALATENMQYNKIFFLQLNKFFVRETVFRSPLLAPSPRRRSGIGVGGATPSARTGPRRPETRSGTPGREGSPGRPTGASGRCPARLQNRRPTRSPERPSGTPGGRRQPQSRGRGAAAGSCGAAAARRVPRRDGGRGGAGGRTRRRSWRRRPRRRRPGNSSWGATRGTLDHGVRLKHSLVLNVFGGGLFMCTKRDTVLIH